MTAVERAIGDIEEKYDITLKSYQRSAIQSVLTGKDTFVVLPTGYGKSYVYTFLPELFDLLLLEHDKCSTVLVISPLQALMIDQVNALNALGISATFVGELQGSKTVANDIRNGMYSIVFASPEAVLTSARWRSVLTRGTFQERLKAVAVDEAHCVTQWGADFRKEYRRINEIHSVVSTGTPFLALTATATEQMRKEIVEALGMSPDTTTVAVTPDRSNITYSFKKTKKNIGEDLQWLVEQTRSTTPKKVIVYCRNIANCATLFEHFMLELADDAYVSKERSLNTRVVGMYHRSTSDSNKQHVLDTFPKADFNLCVVFATIAFGMGVNIPDVDIVVHWGSPRGIEQFAQESGRAGRDGRPSYSVVYYSGHDLVPGRSEKEVKSLCSATSCSRAFLNRHFRLEGVPESLNANSSFGSCKCCSVCRLECNCRDCVVLPWSVESERQVEDNSVPDLTETRDLSPDQLQLLRDNLCDFRVCLLEEIVTPVFGQRDLLIGFSHENIDSIVNSACFLMCPEDVVGLGLWRHELAVDVLELIEEIESL